MSTPTQRIPANAAEAQGSSAELACSATADGGAPLIGPPVVRLELSSACLRIPQLLCDQATVYRHRIAGVKRRSVRTQPHDSFCNLFWLAHPPDWFHSDEARLCFRTH